jgi:hypothetical protein
MSEFTRDAAYLVKNNVPYDRAVAMTMDEAAELANVFRQLDKEVALRYVLWRIATWGTLILVAGFFLSFVGL